MFVSKGVRLGGNMKIRHFAVTVAVTALALAGISWAAPSTALAGEKIGDCEILFDYPHGSVHSSGNVSADMRIKCNTPQRYLGVESFLYRSSANDGYRWQIPGPKNKGENINYISSVAAEPCQNATYWSEANFLIVDNNGVRHERFNVKSGPISNPCRLA